MKKNLLILLGLLIALPSIARDFEYTYEGQTLTYTVLDEAAKTCQTKAGSGQTAGNSVDGVLIIPEKASDGSNEFTVTIIGNRAFYDCDGLTSVTIPESVFSIGEWAFSGCSSLTSIAIPNAVTTIGNFAFSSCTSLTEITIPNSVITLGYDIFRGCSSLQSIEVDAGNRYYSSSNGVLFDKNQKELLMYPCGKSGDYQIPESVVTISASAFEDCSELTNLNIPESVITIGEGAFRGTGLISVVIPNPVTQIGGGAFQNCSKLTTVSLPDRITTLSPLMFGDCINLANISIPNSVTEIGANAFSGCSTLKSIEIPERVTTIGVGAFGRTAIETITIPNGVTTIGAAAFSGCTNLTAISIPNSIPEIGYQTFRDCVNLSKIDMGGSIKTIDREAFRNCSSLESVIIPSSVTTIEDNAFYNCIGLKNVIIGHGVERIGENAFNLWSGNTGGIIDKLVFTAKTPPTAYQNTFNSYDTNIWVLKSAASAYMDTMPWSKFNYYMMLADATEIAVNATTISGRSGDTFQLEAKALPDDSFYPYLFYHSTDTNLATVDKNGLVTIQDGIREGLTPNATGDDSYGTCKIVIESLYADCPVAEVTVTADLAGLEDLIIEPTDEIDYQQPYRVYNMQGITVGSNIDCLQRGIYIVRQGSKSSKIIR